MAYPTDAGQTYTTVNGTDNTEATLSDGLTHSGRHNAVENEVTALKDKVGIDGDTDKDSIDYMLFTGWLPIRGASLEYNSATSFKTTTDVDLTSDIQVGDKITFEQSSTEKFAIVTAIDYDSTVADRTYIQVMGDSVANSAITAGTVGFSRAVRPSKFPIVDFGGARNQGLINGKIVPSVASNNLTVAIKTLADTDPSATNPVGIWIGNELRWITSARSITLPAGTNWFNSGSAELATKEIDYFVYAQWDNSENTVNIGFSRIPYARISTDFVANNESNGLDEKYFRKTGADLTLQTTDLFVNIGRFAATLSASPSHNWSVPSFTNANLIQEPIYETRWSAYVSTLTWTASAAPTGGTNLNYRYQIRNNNCYVKLQGYSMTAGTAVTNLAATLPIQGSPNDATNINFFIAYLGPARTGTTTNLTHAELNFNANNITVVATSSAATQFQIQGEYRIN